MNITARGLDTCENLQACGWKPKEECLLIMSREKILKMFEESNKLAEKAGWVNPKGTYKLKYNHKLKYRIVEPVKTTEQ